MNVPIIAEINGWQKHMTVDESILHRGILYIDIKPPLDYMIMKRDLIIDGTIHRVELRRVDVDKFEYFPSYEYYGDLKYDNIPLEHELDEELFEI